MSGQAFDEQYHTVEVQQHVGLFSYISDWLGAISAIVLVAGLAVWSYQLTMRDVTEVPVIRAMEGKYRERPAQPGGEVATHRGLAVNTVQSDGGVAKPADRVILAPDPVNLVDEDVSLAYLRPTSKQVGLDIEPLNLTAASAVEEDTSAAIDVAIRVAVDEADVDPDLARIAKLPGVKSSPRPKARIRVGLIPAVESLTISDTGASDAVDADPSEVLTGTRLVQLGAFDDRVGAIEEWRHLVDKHGDLLGNHRRLIQEAESGGRRFYRLRMVGFDSLSDSRRMCSALLARGTPCIPVTAR